MSQPVAGGRGRGRGRRGGGGGVALTLNTGNHTHVTLVYFKSLGSHTRDSTLKIASDFCKEKYSSPAKLEVGEMWGPNSIYVTGEMATIKAALVQHFNSLEGYEIDNGNWGIVPHINLKGKDKSILASTVCLSTGWRWM
eukprot:TRINITY_DN4123_c0_g1_i1.p1 TRINITY_DN4123_c0_g1~~TRINITY_DN4123_c0_g1_i1.p1  ORF type:complete len:139 (-),score=19.01 TRINITY_DN4123_c0_g1_i1:37-453(-)